MDFLKKFESDLNKKGIETTGAKPPRYWFSTGNYVLNRIISGSFYKGIPQGRVTGLAGPSGAGKSFLSCNLIRNAQAEGAWNVVIDTEHALDEGFLSGVGIDPTKDLSYAEANTIPDCIKIVSSFIQGYKKEYGAEPDAPKVLITIDSLDMLTTETEETNFGKGVSKGDQGQRNKQLKAMLRDFVSAIKHLNISIVVTSQVYRNQDIRNGEGTWIVSDAVRYSLSQILLLTKLKLKEDIRVVGIKMKCNGFKTRFTKPYQNVIIEVPYDEGMDPLSGLVEVAESLGVVTKKGSRYTVVGEDKSWYSKHIAAHVDNILPVCEEKSKAFLAIDGGLEDTADTSLSVKKQRKVNFNKKAEL